MNNLKVLLTASLPKWLSFFFCHGLLPCLGNFLKKGLACVHFQSCHMFENVRILSSHFISNQIKIFCFLENSEDIAPLCSDIPHWILLFFSVSWTFIMMYLWWSGGSVTGRCVGTFSLILLETQLVLLFLAASSVPTPIYVWFLQLCWNISCVGPWARRSHLSLQIHFPPFFMLCAPGGWFLQMTAISFIALWILKVGFGQWEASAGYWNEGRGSNWCIYFLWKSPCWAMYGQWLNFLTEGHSSCEA